MKLSRSGEYALRAMIYLALENERDKNIKVRIQDIAAKEKIPKKFLEAILLKLRKAGLLKSIRGINGGYCLNKKPEDITIGQIIRLIDGPLAPLGCASVTAYTYCDEEPRCGLQKVMREVRDAIAGILDNYTLKDVVDRTIKLRG
jgi:Rrf2 family protein